VLSFIIFSFTLSSFFSSHLILSYYILSSLNTPLLVFSFTTLLEPIFSKLLKNNNDPKYPVNFLILPLICACFIHLGDCFALPLSW
jgi:hypothetical protein